MCVRGSRTNNGRRQHAWATCRRRNRPRPGRKTRGLLHVCGQGQRPRGQTYSWYTVGYVVFGWLLTSLTSGTGGKGPRTARLRTSKPVSTTEHSCGHDLC